MKARGLRRKVRGGVRDPRLWVRTPLRDRAEALEQWAEGRQETSTKGRDDPRQPTADAWRSAPLDDRAEPWECGERRAIVALPSSHNDAASLGLAAKRKLGQLSERGRHHKALAPAAGVVGSDQLPNTFRRNAALL